MDPDALLHPHPEMQVSQNVVGQITSPDRALESPHNSEYTLFLYDSNKLIQTFVVLRRFALPHFRSSEIHSEQVRTTIEGGGGEQRPPVNLHYALVCVLQKLLLFSFKNVL
jgi:hypothetical protein